MPQNWPLKKGVIASDKFDFAKVSDIVTRDTILVPWAFSQCPFKKNTFSLPFTGARKSLIWMTLGQPCCFLRRII